VAWISEGLLDLALAAAGDDLPVLLLGEPGVGKEVLARRIHEFSSRRQKPWKTVNCAGLTDSLFLEMVFGAATNPGALEEAQGGCFLLADVGELSLEAQGEILERARRGVFGQVRLMGDTNRDVQAEMARGRLLPEFVQLFAGRIIHIPPLRHRPAEILPYARVFIAELATELQRSIPEIGPEAARQLESHSWPGNVRKLRLIMWRALVLSQSGRIEPEHLWPPRSKATRD
jgi:two-component system response regulator AtoC